MLHGKQWLAVAALVTAGLGLTGCAESSQASAGEKAQAAKVTSVDGGRTRQVTLTQEAADRLVIETTPVKESIVPPRTSGGPVAVRTVVPYAALLYDPDGTAWAYTTARPLTYVRHKLDVDYISGDLVVLS